MAVRNRLREIRHELMIDTQVEMAAKLGIQRQHYNRLENQDKQPTIETALKIAKKLNKSVEDIFYLTPEE